MKTRRNRLQSPTSEYSRPLLIIAGLCSVACFAVASPSVAQSKPNIVIFLADDLGYNDLTCYRKANGTDVEGGPTCQTPVIDTLAAEGMRFTDFYTGAPVCSPSRGAILTGRNATRVGMYNWMPPNSPMRLRSSEVTIAECLKNVGYTSGFFGKWHISGSGTDAPTPSRQGFDYGFWTEQNALPSHRNPRNFLRFGRDKEKENRKVGVLRGYSCQLLVDEAIVWLDKYRDESKPFCINLFFHEPHNKCAAPPELENRHPTNKQYNGCIENMDLAVGRMLKKLDAMGVSENTIVMFLSDNGSTGDHPNSNAPLRGAKAFLFDGGVRSPFIVKWPGKTRPGTVSGAVTSATDILPTLCAITGAPLPGDRVLDGADISSLLTGEEESLERENGTFFFRYTHNPICMLRDGDYTLLGYTKKYPPGVIPRAHGTEIVGGWSFNRNHMGFLVDLVPVEFELYNMKTDIQQKDDLADKHPERVAAMKAEMLKLRGEMLAEGGVWRFLPPPARKNRREGNAAREGAPGDPKRP